MNRSRATKAYSSKHHTRSQLHQSAKAIYRCRRRRRCWFDSTRHVPFVGASRVLPRMPGNLPLPPFLSTKVPRTLLCPTFSPVERARRCQFSSSSGRACPPECPSVPRVHNRSSPKCESASRLLHNHRQLRSLHKEFLPTSPAALAREQFQPPENVRAGP